MILRYVLLCSTCLLLVNTLTTIKMGILLSGNGWATGNNSYPAAKVAIKEIESWDWDGGLEIETHIGLSNCAVPSSYQAAYELLNDHDVDVIIGPACSIACEPVSLLAKEFNVPVISYACSGTTLSDKTVYDNFARTAEPLSGASLLLQKAFKEWNFELYSIMTTTQTINVDLAIDFVQQMRELESDDKANSTGRTGTGDKFKLKQLSTVVANLNSDKHVSIRTGTVEQLESFMSDAWVYFLPMYDGDAGFILKNAAGLAAEIDGIEEQEAWTKSNYAWFRYQSLVAPGSEVEQYYDGVFTLENDTPLETNELAYKQFLERFESTEFLDGEAESLKLYLAYMYNSIVAWGTAYKNTGATAGERSTEYEKIIEQLTDLTYAGAYRTEILNAKAEPKNAIWNLMQYQKRDSGLELVKVVTQDLEDADQITILADKIQWPNDEIIDPCKDGRCATGGTNNTVLYVVVGICVVLVTVVIAAAGFIVRRQRLRNEEDRKVEWKVAFTDLDFAVKKSVSGSRKFGLDEKPSNISVAKWNHSYVVVKNLSIPNISITKEILDDIYALKKETHPNLESFYGLCDDPGYCAVITEYCSKGSLEDLAHNENVHLDWMFKLSLVIDVAKGLRHIHNSHFGYHGNLRTSSCVVDSHWVCKVADFGLRNIMKENGEDSKQNSSVTKTTGVNVRDLFYAAPEKLWPCSKERTTKELQKSDTYSFAILMYELFSREAPYDTSEIYPEKIIQKIRNRESPPYRPNIELMHVTEKTSYEQVEADADASHAIPQEAVELMKRCWMEMPFERNNMTDTVLSLEDMNPDRSLSITDRVVKMMEKYSEDLENKVAMKTHQLHNQMAGKTLTRYLPRKVIERIENGLEVDNLAHKYVTAARIGLRVVEGRDQLTAFNEYEVVNHAELESRSIYQVVDGSGQTVVVCGLYNEDNSAEEILKYARTIMTQGRDKLQIKAAIHTDVVSGGMIKADTSNPRLCITGNIADNLNKLLEHAQYGDIIITEASMKELPEQMEVTREHHQINLLDKTVNTRLLSLSPPVNSATPDTSPEEPLTAAIVPDSDPKLQINGNHSGNDHLEVEEIV